MATTVAAIATAGFAIRAVGALLTGNINLTINSSINFLFYIIKTLALAILTIVSPLLALVSIVDSTVATIIKAASKNNNDSGEDIMLPEEFNCDSYDDVERLYA